MDGWGEGKQVWRRFIKVSMDLIESRLLTSEEAKGDRHSR